jgi:MoaA/NifB/PqqE/SkfB family radical SAM enzyme
VAKAAGLEVMVQSNATCLNEAMARDLCEAGLDVMRVSLWAATVEDWTALHTEDSPAQFDAALDGVARLVERRRISGARRPRVVLHQPVTRAGVHGLSDFARLALRLGCDGVSFGLVHDRARAGRDLVPDAAEIGAIGDTLARLRPFLDGHGLSHNLDDIAIACRVGEETWQEVPCYISWLHVVLTQDGTVRPCCRCPVPLGDLRTQSLGAIWNGPAVRAFRRQTRSRDGLARLAAGTCDCTFCPYVADNARVHARARWLGSIRFTQD